MVTNHASGRHIFYPQAGIVNTIVATQKSLSPITAALRALVLGSAARQRNSGGYPGYRRIRHGRRSTIRESERVHAEVWSGEKTSALPLGTSGLCLAGLGIPPVPFLASDPTMNPVRLILIGSIALLWLVCFSTLFSKDRRKSKLKYLQKRKQSVDFVEKRIHQRVSYPLAVLYRVIGPHGTIDTMQVASARDLSENGILLELKQDLSIGTMLELKLTLCGKNSTLLLEGTVCRKDPLSSLGIYAVGVTLEVNTVEKRMLLAQFIEHERRKEEIA